MTVNSSIAPVVITGGAQRLGLAAALQLREDGYPVVVTYRKPRPSLDLLKSKGVETIQAEFKDEAGILRFADELRSRFHSLRALMLPVRVVKNILPTQRARRPSIILLCRLRVNLLPW